MNENKLLKEQTDHINPEEYVSPAAFPLEIYRLALIILGLIVSVVLISMIIFSYNEKEIDTAIVAIGSAALGGIVGIFAGGKNT